MSLSTAPPSRGLVLADALPGARTRSVLLVVGGALLTALMAQVAIPVPGSPVPITGQTLAVLVVAASLGPARGAASMGLYLMAGLVGMPFYSEGASGFTVAFGATGGYLLTFIPAAYVIGLAAARGADRRFAPALLLFIAGQMLIFTVGVPWLAATTGMSASQALAAGLYPFILGGLVKAAIAAAVLPGAWRAVRSSDARN